MKRALLLSAVIMVSVAGNRAGGVAVPPVGAADTLPERWVMDRQFDQSLPTDDTWWRQFNDPLLDSLIAEGEKNNYNLSMALHRIESARQVVNQARSGYFPTVGANVGWTKTRSSGALGGHPLVETQATDYFSLGLSASWEIDLFGRVAAQSKSAKASLGASRADYAAAMVALCSNVASAYFNLRMYQAEYQVALSHIASQEHVARMAEARHEAGLASMLDVHQARTVLYSTQASLPSLEAMIETSVNSIAVLLGCYPSDIKVRLMEPSPLPECYMIVSTGIPMDLLRRRPDIVASEYELAGYAAQLGVAKKDFLPTLSINGTIGTSAHSAGDLFAKESYSYSVAPQLTWTLFDGLARKYKVAQAREQMEAGIDNYNQTVLNAVEEVENAMTAYTTTLRGIGLLQNVIDESQKSLDLSVDMYRQGLTPFSNVVDAQMSLLENQNSMVTSRGKALQALVQLYQALGGGWEGK